jgi:hypothetical protein
VNAREAAVPPGPEAAGYIASWRPSSVTAEAAAFARAVVGQAAPEPGAAEILSGNSPLVEPRNEPSNSSAAMLQRLQILRTSRTLTHFANVLQDAGYRM